MVRTGDPPTKRHLPYAVSQSYLPHDTGERALPYPQPDKSVFDLPTPGGIEG